MVFWSFQEARGRDALGTAGRMSALQDHSKPPAGNGDLLIGLKSEPFSFMSFQEAEGGTPSGQPAGCRRYKTIRSRLPGTGIY
jgi:hypothetical protein